MGGFLLLGAAVACAQIAVFPFEDVSKDINGVDVEASKIVTQKLEEAGFEVIPPEVILNFMARNRIRWTGWVERLTALKVYRELGADLILVGTVTDKDEKKGLFGVTLRLVRATDYQLIWSKTVALATEEKVSLLGLKKLDFPALREEVLTSLIQDLPEELKQMKSFPPEVEIGDVFLRPRFARSGQLIECAVKLNLSGSKPEKIFFVLPDGRRVPAVEDESRKLFLGLWKAPREEGRYPINILFKWGPPWNLEKESFLSSFVVDNTPPKLSLKIRRGEKMGDVIAFRRYVTIVPVLENSEPISRWQMIITNEEGTEVLNVEQPGHLPETFNWRGSDAGGHKLPKGRYHLKLTVWDKAGNSSVATADFLVVKDPPKVAIEAKKGSEGIEIDLKVKDHPVPLSNWYLEVWDEEGNLLGEIEGEGEPQEKIVVPSKKDLFYSLEVRDVLGNRYLVRNQKLKPVILRAAKEKKEEAKKWLEDF